MRPNLGIGEADDRVVARQQRRCRVAARLAIAEVLRLLAGAKPDDMIDFDLGSVSL